ncbi:MAG: glycosyltransferase family 4 protein [Limisphaerales bacterium]
MRILFASSSSGSRGGGELFLLYLAEALARRGHELALWVASHERMDELAEKFSRFGHVQRAFYHNTYDHHLRLLATCLNFSTSFRVALQWRKWKPDVLHINKQNLEDGLDLLRAGVGSGLPSICTIHITQTARFLKARIPAVRDFLSKHALARYKGALVAVNETRGKELTRFLGGRRANIFAVPNGAQIQSRNSLQPVRAGKRVDLAINEKQKLVLGLGRMVAQKRPWIFLSLAEQINRQVPDARFLWVGDGDWASQWDEMVAKRKLGSFVRRISWQVEPLPFLAAGDLFLHTAEFEGLPFALLEAMAAHLPCAIPVQLAKELAIQDSGGILPAEDVPGLVTALQDDARLNAVAENGNRLIQQKFSVERMAERYEELYRQALSAHSAH